jgi:hypothetical protein
MKVIKEIISIILIVVMTTVTMGITLHYHFCGKSEALTVNVLDKIECHCKPVEVSSCCELNDEPQSCGANINNNNVSKVTLTHDKCCVEYSATMNLDETFLSSTFNSISLKYPTAYVKSIVYDVDTFKQLKTYEKKLKTYYSGFKRNIIKFIHLLASLDKKDITDDSL